jgi:hypothetical protein
MALSVKPITRGETMRKSIDIANLVAMANAMLSAEEPSKETRMGIIALLDRALHDTGRYAGYNYQPSEFLPADLQSDHAVLRPDYDDSRRVYYVKQYKH